MSEATSCPACGAPTLPGVGCTQCRPQPDEAGRSGDETATLPPGPGGSSPRVGPYKLLDVLGEGGMGIVYLAEQERPLRRRVALKLIKPGMDTKQVIARFESERQALALLTHPHIARVFDAGTTDRGHPYFVMEHVPGIPITRFGDAERLNVRQRLELFTQVCEAVQHAHQKGIIHRDLKPSNVLVSLVDGVATPKVIDFGVAKATSLRLTEQTVHTQLGGLVGTPEYMSPEQSDPSALDIDTRTDIYSLGVLLYELLVGVLPYDGRRPRRMGFDEWQRLLREEEPARPSARMSTLRGADEVAWSRRTRLPALRRALRGDLDWIVMRALEKERMRRYPSASELAADVRRYLAGEAVLARPPSATYRLRKLVRKHRGPVAAAAAIVATIVVMGSLTYVQGMRARRQAMEVRANSILVAASAADDPLVRFLLLNEVGETRDLPGRLAIAHQAASSPLPIRVFRGHRGPINSVAFSPDGANIVTAASDGARIWRLDGTGELATFAGHEDWIRSAVFDSDGRRVLTASDDDTARLWRIDDSGESVVFEGHESWVLAAAFGPDDDLVVTASRDGTARVWRADGTGAPVVLRGHEDVVQSAELSPDGTRVVTASLDGTARIWPLDGSGKPIVLRGHGGPVLGAAFHPDGTRVATASADGTVRLWSVDDWRQIAELGDHQGRVQRVRFSPDGTRIVTAGADGTARIRVLDDGEDPITLRGHAGPVNDAAFSPDGSLVVTASVDGTARLWSTRWSTGSRVLQHAGEVTRATYSSDGSRIVTASSDGTARIWSADGRGRAVVIQGHTDAVLDATFSPDDSLVATASKDHTVHLASADGAGEPLVLRGHEGPVVRVVFSPDGDHLATASTDATARVWRVDGAGPPLVLRGHEDRLNDLAFGIDGATVATVSDDGTTRLWPVDGGETAVLQGDEGPVLAVAFNPRKPLLATAHEHDTAHLWRTDGTGEPIVLGDHQDWVRSVAFSPDGRLVVTASDDHWARIWRTDSEGDPVVLSGHEDYVYSAVFSPGGELVLTASRDGTARLWRADGGRELVVLDGHHGEVVGAAFSPDGTHVVTASADGTARIWLVDWRALLERLRASTQTCLIPEQRMRFLAESASQALAAFVACERRYGRDVEDGAW